MVLEIDLSNTNIDDFEIKRQDGHSSIAFSAERTVEGVDEVTIEEAFLPSHSSQSRSC